MNIAVVLLIILGILFAVAFFTRRRFGVLGLALAGGSILSGLLATDLTPVIRDAGLELVSPPLASVVAASLVLLPAIALLFSGPSYKKMSKRIIGASAFALLAFAFLLPILRDALILEGDGKEIFDTVADYGSWIIVGGILFAIFDLLTAKSKKEEKEK
jgi:hypothetical protein